MLKGREGVNFFRAKVGVVFGKNPLLPETEGRFSHMAEALEGSFTCILKSGKEGKIDMI